MFKFFFLLVFTLSLHFGFGQDSAEEDIEYKYAQGYYVDTSGTKHIGQILIRNKKILFYSDNNEKIEKIRLNTIDTLLLNGKRFLVIKKIKLKAEMGIRPNHFKTLIAEEVISGKINLYKAHALTNLDKGLTMDIVFSIGSTSLAIPLSDQNNQPSYGELFYIIQKEKGAHTQVKTGNKKFRRLITSLTQDNKDAFNEINIQKKDYYNLIEIVQLYNSKY